MESTQQAIAFKCGNCPAVLIARRVVTTDGGFEVRYWDEEHIECPACGHDNDVAVLLGEP